MIAVVAAIGLCSLFNVAATMIIFEVVPFLVLAVGVDNIFIIVQAYQRDVDETDDSDRTALVEQMRFERVVGRVAPSMLMSSIIEAACFFLAAVLSPMPAVQVFALYASLAVVFGFLLQMSCFLAALGIDVRREAAARSDIIFFWHVGDPTRADTGPGLLYTVVRHYYAPLLFNWCVRPAVVVVGLLMFCASLAVLPRVDIGLDQKLAFPTVRDDLEVRPGAAPAARECGVGGRRPQKLKYTAGHS